ncbi:Lipoprotein [Roseomonas mucosa]|uniref:Endolytic peptidoglycan transglycosylase RlpA n=1 Tax=Roseomonas mucosa TaxID=207340 RepID=A0A1S8D1P1_9PROT|nr:MULTISPECIES: RlpA-like double-psi beta-barrel domain-containing protein [Roseomonas]MBS5901188.1 SPOR domain-containing protein [Acetobacteraceae bacterium]MDT8264527.1 RlpA-like double-psi beta-barrel domain-containing protein [Roseomonas sp. DSM 102946]ATR20414.1 sporulation and cell division repeat protein [Roseomonas sp. FDAARGOS_362]MCG7354183.1 SPOR domain-containing protein [Roseomonas mucosa]MCG7359266.1 SPOR domain-containing protein [Roseomonas mucosa]
MAVPAVLALGLVLASCGPRTPPVAPTPAVYTIGQPYSMGGLWSYPREDYGLAETGLATVLPGTGDGRRTADGETYDPALLTAQHRTLQLPAILRVTNLENGRSLSVRVNDRGPQDPGRVIGLSPRAAELLGIARGRPAQVRIEVEAEPSRALAASLARAPGEMPALSIATAAAGTVQRESLGPPPGARGSQPGRAATLASGAVAVPEPDRTPPPERLPERVSQGPAMPGRLMIQLGSFTGADAARRLAARVPGARAEPFGPGRRPEWRVRLGPFPDTASADRALEQVLRTGVSEARILVD